jgi:type IV pilus assembly protein PilE
MERWRTERGTYLNGGNAPPLPLVVSPPTGTPKYTVGFQGNPTAAGYVLAATPVGSMAGDECGLLTLSNTGLRGKTGAANIDLCWGR